MRQEKRDWFRDMVEMYSDYIFTCLADDLWIEVAEYFTHE